MTHDGTSTARTADRSPAARTRLVSAAIAAAALSAVALVATVVGHLVGAKGFSGSDSDKSTLSDLFFVVFVLGLLAGVVLALVATGNVVAASVNERTRLRRLDTRFLIKDSPCFVGLNKSEPALLAEVNRIIGKSKKDGALNDISKKWLLAPLPANL